MQQLVRHGADERRLDRLLVAAIIEARSHERLALLAGGLEDAKLRRLYQELARSEDGHQKLFVRLALRVEDRSVVAPRLEALLEAEGALVARLPVRAAIH
jgi:tRNA-(ms[2]io[6]A)-hydroxylase